MDFTLGQIGQKVSNEHGSFAEAQKDIGRRVQRLCSRSTHDESEKDTNLLDRPASDSNVGQNGNECKEKEQNAQDIEVDWR